MKPGLLLITTSFPSGVDGSEAAGGFVIDWARALARHCRVSVVAPARDGDRVESGDGIRVFRYHAPLQPLSLLNPARPSHWRPILTTLRRGGAAVRRAVEAEAIDHALALWTLPCGLWAQRECGQRGIPWSTWALGSDIWKLGRVPGLRRLLRQVLSGATHCYADGHALADEVRAIGGRPCSFLPSCRDLSAAGAPRARAAAPPYRLAYLGRWHPNKGVDLLLEALGRLGSGAWARIEQVRIAGGGPLEPLVGERICALQAAGRPVRRLGFLGREAATSLLDWADWLILPSRIESIPVVFSDALQRGCPMIATPVGDLPRLHAEQPFGVLAEAVSAGAVAKAIERALEQPARDWQGALARRARDFSTPLLAGRLAQQLFGDRA